VENDAEMWRGVKTILLIPKKFPPAPIDLLQFIDV